MKSLSRILIGVLFLLTSVSIYSQTHEEQIEGIKMSDFSPVLSFLSSDWMEGREAGAKGGFMAADYIASMMELYQLEPYGDKLPGSENKDFENHSLKANRSFFQDFEIIKYKVDNVSLSFISEDDNQHNSYNLIQGVDFNFEPDPKGIDAEAPLVFAGYGISASDEGYNDYKSLDVRGKIVIILNGFPGHKDSLSVGCKKFGTKTKQDYSDLNTKVKTAEKRGAIALIEVAADGSYKPYSQNQSNLAIVQSSIHSDKPLESNYTDDFYYIPGDTSVITLPLFRLGPVATGILFESTGLDLKEIEQKAAEEMLTFSTLLKFKSAGISLTIKAESLKVRNVLGFIPGIDTSKCMIVGAHYDHLGIRGNTIYNGADDNASGVAGMLAIAKVWKESNVRPPCNLIFASWTAEEKGLFGSHYFVDNLPKKNQKVLLYINLDMVSRSSSQDTSCLELSIGLLKNSEELKQIAIKNNQLLLSPFNLDLWKASEDGGSDYAPFASYNIPIMTFFSGYQDDYHTPQDTFNKVDLSKMQSVLWLVNKCLMDVAKDLPD
jgi:hypothetical protein